MRLNAEATMDLLRRLRLQYRTTSRWYLTTAPEYLLASSDELRAQPGDRRRVRGGRYRGCVRAYRLQIRMLLKKREHEILYGTGKGVPLGLIQSRPL